MICRYCEQPIYSTADGIWRNWDDDVYCPQNIEYDDHEPLVGNEKSEMKRGY